MTRVLVTGREGQLVRSLIERGAATELDILPLGRPLLDLEDSPGISRVVRDIAPDILINAAAYTNVDAAEKDEATARRINAEAPGELAAATAAAGIPIVHVSTDYVFDGASADPYDETSPTCPLGVYGRTKLEGEERVRAVNPDHAIVRTAWVYSPWGRNFLKTMMSLAEQRDTLRVVGDQRGNPTSALDLADGLLALVKSVAAGHRTGLGQTYHLAGTGSGSWADFAQRIMTRRAALGLPSAIIEPITTAEWPTPARRPANSTLASEKFARQFRFRMPDWGRSTDLVVDRVAQEASLISEPPVPR